MTKHKVLIVGGGFAGVKAAIELRGHADIEVTMLSDSVDFHYYPTFYHTATGGLREQSNIPLRELFNDKSVRFVLGRAKRLDRQKQVVVTGDSRKFRYDTLILALGSTTNYFHIPGLDKYAYGIKSMEEISRFKKHVHDQLVDDRQPELNYVVVGGGPTGIELAGAMPSYLQFVRRNHGLRKRKLHIDLVEGAPRLLPRCTPATSRAVSRRLRQLGVKLYLGARVEALDTDHLTVNGKPIMSHTVVWTAGVANNPFFKDNGFQLNERGKVIVDEFLRAEPHIFVLGDNNDTRYSGMAQTALLDAENVARNLIRITRDEPPKAYKPAMPVTVIPVGPDWAAVEWGKLHFAGRSGWVLRAAADWIGFSDIEPWYKAVEQWFTEFGRYEECTVCKSALQELSDKHTLPF